VEIALEARGSGEADIALEARGLSKAEIALEATCSGEALVMLRLRARPCSFLPFFPLNLGILVYGVQ
jgi:hypothetical protein